MHQVGAHESGELKRARENLVSGLGHAQEQKGDERHRDLNADGILRRSKEVLDLQGLFDPSEEQLDLPALLEDQALLWRSEEHTSELQSHLNLVCRLLLEKK